MEPAGHFDEGGVDTGRAHARCDMSRIVE